VKRWLCALLLPAYCYAGAAVAPDYALAPQRIADGVWWFEGLQEHFTRSNGGNIANTGFIVGRDGVVVIDSGPSRQYGEQMRKQVEAHSGGKKIVEVLITHAHPDHFLGNQAFNGIRIEALPQTVTVIAEQGETLSANLYRLVGAWMQGTEVRKPEALTQTGERVIGGRKLRLIALQGHTEADLAVYDEASRTLFAGDLVFFHRAATTPNANIAKWLAALDALQKIDFQTLVPGHGPVVHGPEAIAETRAYLVWLRDSLHAAAANGLDMMEVANQPIPERFRSLAVVQEEHTRSVSHLYPAMELEALSPAK